MIEILLGGLLQCMVITDLEEFSRCLDQVVIEYNHIVEVNEMVLDDEKE